MTTEQALNLIKESSKLLDSIIEFSAKLYTLHQIEHYKFTTKPIDRLAAFIQVALAEQLEDSESIDFLAIASMFYGNFWFNKDKKIEGKLILF